MAGMAAAGIGLFAVWFLMSREPDPYHERRFSTDWKEPIQQQMNPDAVRIPPPSLKPLTKPATAPTTLPMTRATTRRSGF
jgi:hypothetical protein